MDVLTLGMFWVQLLTVTSVRSTGETCDIGIDMTLDNEIKTL